MQTHLIGEMISNAVAHEQHSGTLATLLAQYARARGARPNPAEIAQTVGFIREYVEHVPALLEATAAAAQQVGAAPAVLPILETAVQYFLSPLDLIPDHLGLVGLMDDAYLAHSLIQAICGYHQQRTGMPLLSIDLTRANGFIRAFIGEPVASQLDMAVANTLQLPNIQQATLQLSAFSTTLPMADTSWGSTTEDRIAQFQAEYGAR